MKPNIRQGVQMLAGGYCLEMSKESDSFYVIERIYIPKDKRRQGLFTAIINALVNEADKENISLYMNIYPDGYAQGIADDIADGMRRVAERNGFTTMKLDGEVYRNDLTYRPKKRRL